MASPAGPQLGVDSWTPTNGELLDALQGQYILSWRAPLYTLQRIGTDSGGWTFGGALNMSEPLGLPLAAQLQGLWLTRNYV